MKKIVIFLLISSFLLAKDINVGDLVRIKVNGVAKEEIVNGFEGSNLQLENLEKTDDGYILSIRGYQVGSNSVVLGDKKLTLDIKSVLDDKDKEIYPHLSDNSDTFLYSARFPYVLVISSITALLALIYLIRNLKFPKREKYISPEERFERKMATLNNDTWDFDLSMSIREYIDSKYQTHFVNGKYEIVGMIDSDDIRFITNLDNYKFSKDSRDLKDETLRKVREIYEKIRGDKNA